VNPGVLASNAIVDVAAGQSNGKPLAVSTQRSRLQAVRHFGRWLLRDGEVVRIPADSIRLPRLVRHLQPILSRTEVDRLFAIPDTGTRIGVRDRAIMEVLYSTAISTSQVAAITQAAPVGREGFVEVVERDQARLLAPAAERTALAGRQPARAASLPGRDARDRRRRHPVPLPVGDAHDPTDGPARPAHRVGRPRDPGRQRERASAQRHRGPSP